MSEYAHGFNRNQFHAGGERHLALIDLRGGMRFSQDSWDPAGGFGLNFGKVSLDLAAFTTHSNIERERRVSYAASLRINREERQ